MPAPSSSRRSPGPALAAGAIVVATALVLAACGGGEGGARTDDGRLRVVTSFYPLQWVAEQVGGDHVAVTSLTKPGAEPHDLELTPTDVASVHEAGIVAYLSGFQPSVDDAVAEASSATFDARRSARLDLTTPAAHDDDAHDGDGHDGSEDPHFWLDPTRLASVARAFSRSLSDEDPDNAAAYRTNLAALEQQLDELDGELRDGLADCDRRDLVTSHAAFGYLARRYDLHQVPITGLTPEDEPSPSDLTAATDFVREHDVRTVYFETLVSRAVAKTVATETGARTAVLDPIEGLTDESPGDDYLEVMAANLASLQEGQPCRVP